MLYPPLFYYQLGLVFASLMNQKVNQKIMELFVSFLYLLAEMQLEL
jgi:hypothetical protein